MLCWLQVRDVARAFDTVLHKGIIGQTYNIGTQKERSVNEVVSAIAKYFNLGKGCIEHVPDRAFNDQRCDFITLVSCSCCKLQQGTGCARLSLVVVQASRCWLLSDSLVHLLRSARACSQVVSVQAAFP